jgi:putative restriction endonuclease
MNEHYIEIFGNLKTDKSKSRWNAETTFRAPHKPLLLLAIIDRFAEGAYTANLIEFDDDLSEFFAIYWSLIDPPSVYGNIAMPLYHLESDTFWHLLPREGYEDRLKYGGKIHSIRKLRETVYGAKLDDGLYDLLQQQEARDTLRTVLINTYFAPEIRQKLIRQGKINLESYFYSQDLLAKVKGQKMKETAVSETDYLVRDQGFKRTMYRVYDHRCVLCGIRVKTAEGRTAVVGAHIIPWSISHNDDPRNGLSLCRLCHWTFDEGLLTVNLDYVVRTSPQLNSLENMPAHLALLNRRGMIRPDDSDFLPDPESLSWHMDKVFRQR